MPSLIQVYSCKLEYRNLQIAKKKNVVENRPTPNRVAQRMMPIIKRALELRTLNLAKVEK